MMYGKNGAIASSKSNLRTAGAKDGNRQVAARKSPKQIVRTELAINQ